MTAEPQAALSVRISGRTKRYLDAVAEKKGIGVGKVLDQIVAELEDIPDEKYLLQHAVRFTYMNTFYLRALFNRIGHLDAMKENADTLRRYCLEMFGPLPRPPERFKNPDLSGRPNEVAALYELFGLYDPYVHDSARSTAAPSSSPAE